MRLNLEVLLILDALDKHGSFASAAESLFKTPAALSYMIQKLENDLNITLLDRSGHRAKFTDTGRMMLEKGRLLLNAAKDLEKQAVQLSAGWERDLAIALDDSFPFSALLPLIDAFYAQHPQTRLNFTHHTLAGSWEELTHNGADIILGAINEPPTSAEWSWKMLGAMDNIFVIAPGHPLAETTQPLTNKQLSLHRAVVISDSAATVIRSTATCSTSSRKFAWMISPVKSNSCAPGWAVAFYRAILPGRGWKRASWSKNPSSPVA